MVPLTSTAHYDAASKVSDDIGAVALSSLRALGRTRCTARPREPNEDPDHAEVRSGSALLLSMLESGRHRVPTMLTPKNSNTVKIQAKKSKTQYTFTAFSNAPIENFYVQSI